MTGFEPATFRSRGEHSTAELSRHIINHVIINVLMCGGRCGLVVMTLDFHSGDPGSIPGIGCFCLCTLLFMPEAVACFCNPVTLQAESLGKVMRSMRCLACFSQMPSPGGEVGNWHGIVTCRGDRHPNISR